MEATRSRQFHPNFLDSKRNLAKTSRDLPNLQIQLLQTKRATVVFVRRVGVVVEKPSLVTPLCRVFLLGIILKIVFR